MRKSSLGMVLALACGCGDRDVEIARQLLQADPNGGPPSVLMIGDCQTYGFIEMDRACVVDADGKAQGFAGGRMIATSVTPPYGVYFLFVDGAVPLAEDISTAGPDAPIQVYAVPCDGQSGPCFAEGNPMSRSQENRIAARASLTAEGGLLVTVHDALPVGTAVAVILSYEQLYRGLIHPADGNACTLPFDLCTLADHWGWVARFYVGKVPNLPTEDGVTPQGTGT